MIFWGDEESLVFLFICFFILLASHSVPGKGGSDSSVYTLSVSLRSVRQEE